VLLAFFCVKNQFTFCNNYSRNNDNVNNICYYSSGYNIVLK